MGKQDLRQLAKSSWMDRNTHHRIPEQARVKHDVPVLLALVRDEPVEVYRSEL